VLAIAERVAFFNVVTCLAIPIAHLAIVFAPGMYGMVVNGNLSFASSFALEIGGLVHVAVDTLTDTGDGIGSSQAFGTMVHGKSFGLEGLLKSSNAMSDLNGLGVVGAEVLDFAL